MLAEKIFQFEGWGIGIKLGNCSQIKKSLGRGDFFGFFGGDSWLADEFNFVRQKEGVSFFANVDFNGLTVPGFG